MAQMNLIVTPAFEAALERLVKRRGFANRSEAVRTVVEEAAGVEETPEEIRAARLVALRRLRGILPKDFDYQKERDWIYEGMDDL